MRRSLFRGGAVRALPFAQGGHAAAPVDGVGASRLAFFTAARACLAKGRHPHPIEGRNANVVGACRDWLSAGAIPDGEEILAQLEDPRSRYHANAETLLRAIAADPARRRACLRSGVAADADDGTGRCVVVPYMFWTRPHVLIEGSDALERMLLASDLGDDLPAGLFRPPAPACYLHFGPAFQDALAPAGRYPRFGESRPQGVYVFETNDASGRALALVTIHEVGGQPGLGIDGVDLRIDDEGQVLVDLIRNLGTATTEAHQARHLALIDMVAKTFLYFGLPGSIRREERPHSETRERLARQGPRKAARSGRRLNTLYDRILLGPSEIPGHGNCELSPHLRRGHFRMQPHGPQMALRKLIYIAPTWVRPDKLAVVDTATPQP